MTVCVCGHDRDHHAWGTGACALVYPPWTCPSGCFHYWPKEDPA